MWDDVLLYVAVGFVAQMIDGAIGMAYGVMTTSVLLSFGVSPVAASACVHAAEVFTTGASALAHWRLGNVDRALVTRLAFGGIVGGVIGVFILTSLPGQTIRPFVAAYLVVLGAVILLRSWRGVRSREVPLSRLPPLGLAGGTLDAIGGGGWGAIVTSTLVCHGMTPRKAVGSVSASEFFVTSAISATFVTTVGVAHWHIIGGLVAGGVLAAPFAAIAVRRIPGGYLMVLVGVVVMLLGTRTLLQSFG
jgi:uncharacterized protein